MIFVGVFLILLSSAVLIWGIPKIWEDSYQGERLRPVHVLITILCFFSGLCEMIGVVFIVQALL